MSLAEETRAAVRARPALYDALRAGVLNYAAAARWLDVGDDREAVATALRRFEDRLSPLETASRDVRVRMNRVGRDDEGPIRVGDETFAPADGSFTAVLATGDIETHVLEHVLGVLRANDISPHAAAVTSDSFVLVVDRRDGANALRHVEEALEHSPN